MTARAAILSILAVVLGGIGVSILAAYIIVQQQAAPLPKLYTNESFLENIRAGSLDLNNPREVFSYVFAQLSPEVDVYPTENYYYFQFFTGGYDIRGNIRLDAGTRDHGEVNFAYFATQNRREGPFAQAIPLHHRVLTAADGVRLTKESSLGYLLTYRGKTVRFHLNNLPQTQPEGLELRESERFIFRTFDESGFQLALVYDTASRGFRFLLDETAPLPDTLEPLGEDDDHLLIGRRSGFAFYNDPQARRKVLVGIDNANRTQNNYYDGPFDQLADNFITDDTFLRYAEAAYPQRAGRLTRRGVFLDDAGQPTTTRLALQPYRIYLSLDDLLERVQQCEEQENPLACLTRDADHLE